MLIRNTESDVRGESTGVVVTAGEALLRLATPAGQRLSDAPSLDVHVAGAEANVAAGLARLGVPTRWVSRLPDSALGRRAAAALADAGVILDAVEWAHDGRVGLFFSDTGAGARPTTVLYDRAASAFTALRTPPAGALTGARLLHLTGITAALGMRELLDALLAEAARSAVPVCVDVNHRALLWSATEAREGLTPLLAAAEIVVCAERDARAVLDLGGEPEALLNGLRDRWAPRAQTLVLTRGAAGAVALDADGQVCEQPAIPTATIDRFGMGDAFVAGLLWGLLAQEPLPFALRAGATLAALKATVDGDLSRTDANELRAALRSQPEGIVR
ncbi:MAG TPA: sugar kinase [Conexibacter sp.]